MSRKDRLKNSSVESEKIIKEIKQAQNDIKNAENFFQDAYGYRVNRCSNI